MSRVRPLEVVAWTNVSFLNRIGPEPTHLAAQLDTPIRQIVDRARELHPGRTLEIHRK